MGDEQSIGLAFFLQPTYFFFHPESLQLDQARPDLAPEEIDALKERGFEYVTLQELRERSPEWRTIHDRLEKQLGDTGSA